jgi:alkanesulfonate monooxygenase SsuD/methylene tetrahydromethanopterin reductase-like flavin-dependent oxidoreductase (luciferase family)
VVCGRNEAELERSAAWFRQRTPDGQSISLDELLDRMREELRAVVGTPDQVVEQLRAYERAGIEEVMIQLYDVTDFAMVHLLAEQVLPRVRASGVLSR